MAMQVGMVQPMVQPMVRRMNDGILPFAFASMPLVDDLSFSRGTSPAVHTRSTIGTFDNFDTGLVDTAGIDVERFESPNSTINRSFFKFEGKSENLALHNRDFTDIVWDKSVSMGAVKNATGADGVANAASTLTASAANQTAFQTVMIASAEFTYYIDVRRKTGFGPIEISDDDGTTPTDIASLINTSTYTRFEITTTQANPVFGVEIVTSGDEIEVDYAGLEALGHASARIETAGSPVTRTTDLLVLDTSNFVALNTDFSIAITVNSQNLGNDMQAVHISGLAGNSSLGHNPSNFPRFRYAAKNSLGSTAFNSNPLRLVGTWGAGGNQKIYVDGTLEDTDTIVNATGGTTQLTIGSQDIGGSVLYGHITNLRIDNITLNDEQAAVA